MASPRNSGRPRRKSPAGGMRQGERTERASRTDRAARSSGRADRGSGANRTDRGSGAKRTDRGSGAKRVDRTGRAAGNQEPQPPRSWGGVARRGAGRLRDARASKASAAWREASQRPEGPSRDEWVRVDRADVRDEASSAVARGRQDNQPGSAKRQKRTAPDVTAELERAAGPAQAPKLGARLADATRAFERERFAEARTILRPLAQRAPGSPAVRELYGLTLYRLGQWKEATRELEAFVSLTGSTEQHPVLADCARALENWDRVEDLWRELRGASPAPELVAEGRIVAAGALADRGELRGAIALLGPAVARVPNKPREHHLRLLYAMADLQERAGDLPAARGLFRRIAVAAPGYADIEDRLRGLR